MAAARSRSRPARKGKAAPARASARERSAPASRRGAAQRKQQRQQRTPLLAEGQGRELLGLALCAVGAFAALVLWAGFDGAVLGAKLRDVLEAAVGSAAGLMPVVLVFTGVGLLLRGDPQRLRPFRLGGIALALGLVLAVAGTSTASEDAREQGGAVGNGLRSVLEGFAGELGARVVIVFLVLAGVLLVSGASAGALMRRSADAARSSARTVVRATVETVPQRPRPVQHRRPAPKRTPAELDGETRFPDVFEPAPAAPAEPVEPLPQSDAFPLPEPDPEPQLVVDEEITDQVDHGEPLELFPRGDGAPPYALPDPSVLRRGKPAVDGSQEAERVARVLLGALTEHGVEARLVGTVSGPRVTRYELQLAAGTKVSRVSSLRDDLAYALATTEIRILAPIPGKQAVGVEVPNRSPNLVALGDLVDDVVPTGSSPLTVWLGKDIAGHAVCADLSRMPHLLIAGTTGSGKSGCINAMLCSILLRASPEEVRMILIDPKKVELNHYETIPHLLTPVVTNMKNAAQVLGNVVREMESRYDIMGIHRARNLIELNRARARDGKPPLPYMLVVIDELADLMMVSPTEVEDAVIRLAQKSRAVGIHLLLATQRPSVDVITGMIKANVPSRIAFAVSSQTDSRVILDTAGAESLLGSGDMLYKPLGTSRLQRVQGAYIGEEEIALLVEQCRRQGEPEFTEELLEAAPDVEPEELDPDEDPLLDDAILCVAQHETASVSLLQRRLRVGYTRAGRLIDMLERRGVISGYEGSKPRRVLVDYAEAQRMAGRETLTAGE